MKKTFKLIFYGAIGALFVLSTPLSFAPPDPDIFDGTKYKDEQEKQSLIRQMITKRPQFGRPGPFNSEGKPNAQGGMSQKQNQKGQEQGGQTQNQQQQASGQEGDQQGGGGEPSEEVEEGAGGALGGEFDEEKELPPEQQGGGGMAGMESMDPGSLEDMQQAMGGGELEEAKKMTNAIQLSSPAEMIEMAEELKRQGEQQQLGQVEGSQESQSNRPMAGRNKGLSRGVESGESISTEL